MTERFDENEISLAMQGAEGWERRGDEITRTYELPDFLTAVDFVNRVAHAAERDNHHPDIDIRYNRVTLTLSTHSAGGLTAKDFSLALQADSLAEDVLV